MGVIVTLVLVSRLTISLISEYHADPFFTQLLRHPKESFEIRDGLLFRGSRICIPDGPILTKLLYDYHSTPCTGPLGETKILNRLILLYYWKNMRDTVNKFVKSCRTCQQIKPRNHKPFGSLQPILHPKPNGR